ncbi:MAG: dihydroneopterin aldolase [Bacteroidetes bacterium]|jgi:dihydroneopterin aldolase|nr:dihydroneopterin aldolase [Flavobacteriaceae bacterium]MDG1941828.1 dihydroneopterin aldolase [Flavobacteriaceae bacterium]NCF30490.1 dihydroneopterin aldolase [Bacteroidota bacterium]
MGKVILTDIRIYAFHGCMEEEERIGSDYIVNLEVEADMKKASATDALVDAVDYVNLNTIVKEEMSVRSKLLEHVGQRIIDRILKQFPEVLSVEVSVAKQNPPIGGDVGEVCVCLKG